MMQNNAPRPQPENRNKNRNRIFLLISAVLVVALLTAAIIYALRFNASQNTSQQPGNGTSVSIGGGTGTPTKHGRYPGPCNTNSPYGFTTVNADAALVNVYKQLNVCWVRYQVHWDKIETSQGNYDWSSVDAAVSLLNAAGIHIDFPIQKAPLWDRPQVCAVDGAHYLPGSSQMASFATILATRYDGKHGHGIIDSYEIGNEEYDQHYTGNIATTEQCRSANNYGPVLKAGYQAIKAVNPKVTVGMFGQWEHNITHIQTFFTNLYSQGYGPYMDYMNFHYYNGGQDPAVTHGTIPSFDQWWQAMHTIASQYGFASKPIWVTEVGWPTHTPKYNPNKPVATDVQAQYLQYVMNESANSHVVQKVFWFTIDYGDQADNIYPPTGPLPAFSAYQDMVNQRPTWA